tara:strand:- start:184 stop:807 length:624 start_codon:yes stop_codon:yes gene_type:complete
MNTFDFSDIFFFRVNSLQEIKDGDISFCVDLNNWPDISFSEGIVLENKKKIPIHLQDISYSVKLFGPNWLAYNITNSNSKSDDIFENNDDLVEQYVKLDSSIDPSGMKQLIQNKLSNAGTNTNPLSNANITINNITRDILHHFLNNEDPNILFRLDKMMQVNNGQWKSILFEPGDIIQFDIIYDSNVFAMQNYVVDNQDYIVNIYLN